MIDALAEERSSDEQKIDLALRTLVDAEPIWKAIDLNRAYFSQDIHSDGGFTLPITCPLSWSLSARPHKYL